MKHMGGVVHFEMPYEEEKRVVDFYTTVFGWDMKPLGSPMRNYVLAGTGENDEKGFPKTTGRINGGFFQKKPDFPAQYPSVVIHVEDIHEAMKKIAEAGGTVLGEPVDIPGQGPYVSFFDTEGNRASMIQPSAIM